MINKEAYVEELTLIRQVLELGLAGVVIVVEGLVIRYLWKRCEKLEDERLAMALKSQEQIKDFVDTVRVVLNHLKNGGGG